MVETRSLIVAGFARRSFTSGDLQQANRPVHMTQAIRTRTERKIYFLSLIEKFNISH